MMTELVKHFSGGEVARLYEEYYWKEVILRLTLINWLCERVLGWGWQNRRLRAVKE